MHGLISLLIFALDVYFWIVILTVVASWLVLFGVLNTRNKAVYRVCDLLNRATNPLVLRLRKIIPPLGGIDITPIIIIFGIYFLQRILYELL